MIEFIENINKHKKETKKQAAKLEAEMTAVFKEKGRKGVIDYLKENGLSKEKMLQFGKCLEIIDLLKNKDIQQTDFSNLEKLVKEFNEIK